jgi:hypothetical protein
VITAVNAGGVGGAVAVATAETAVAEADHGPKASRAAERFE